MKEMQVKVMQCAQKETHFSTQLIAEYQRIFTTFCVKIASQEFYWHCYQLSSTATGLQGSPIITAKVKIVS